MPTIFITGSSSGLGYATATLFAAKGWQVIATMRTPAKDSASATGLTHMPGITVLPLDVTNPAQITATVAQVLALGSVDVVFNNAGYLLAGPLEGTSNAQLLRELETNLLGVIRVTQAFLPHFRARHQGLFITTTSLGALIADPLTSIYAATKAALEAWSASLYFELRQFGIGIKTLVTGLTQTNIANSVEVAQHPAYIGLVNQVLGKFTSPEAAARAATPEQIVQVVWEAATDGKDQLRYLAGEEAQQRYAHQQAVGADAVRQEVNHYFFGE